MRPGTLLLSVLAFAPFTDAIAQEQPPPAIGEGRWMRLASSTPHQYHGAVAVDGRIYVLGGAKPVSRQSADFEKYDPETDAWRSLPQMPTPRSFLAVAAVGSKIYTVGGIPNDHPKTDRGSDSASALMEIYDITTSTWTVGTPMPTPRNSVAAVAYSGLVYVIGGMGPGGDMGTVEVYDPTTGQWTTRAHMPTARHGHSVVLVDGKILVVGGYLGTPLDVVEEYDPVTDRWTRKSDMPTPRGFFGMGVANGYVYALGGRVRGDPPIELYDPHSDSWKHIGVMPGGFRNRFGTAVVNDLIYIIGGEYQGERHTATDLLRYEPFRTSTLNGFSKMGV